MMLSLLASAVLGQAAGTLGMGRANYSAGSMGHDHSAPGGYALSNYLPKRASAPPAKFEVQLKRKPASIRVRVVNGGSADVWLPAADSNLRAWLEAERAGAWVPIEYHSWYSCGNSYHQVLLSPGYEWVYEVPMPQGTWRTRVRWVRLSTIGTRVVSSPLEASIPADRWQYRGHPSHEVTQEWTVPTLRPKRQR